MSGRRCSLCGGRLDRNNICTECGLDNTKSDANYSMRQNTADYGELTHTHHTPKTHGWEEKTVQRQEKNRKKKARDPEKRVGSAEARRRMDQAKRSFEQHGQMSGRNQGDKRYRGAGTVRRRIPVVRIVTSLALLGILLSFVFEIISTLGVFEGHWFGSKETEYDYDTDYEYDPYQYLTRDFLKGGEAYSAALEAGEYIVGIHLPEGRYEVKGNREDYGSIQVEDTVNNLYYSYFMSGGNNYTEEDVRLFLGARVTLDTAMSFSSDNARLPMLDPAENPLAENVLLESGAVTAGEAFEPGVYDLMITKGYGSIEIEVPDGEGGSLDNLYLWMDADDSRKNLYRNVALPEGTQVNCVEPGMQVTLMPSESIVSTDYTSYYTGEFLEREPFAGELGENGGNEKP